MNLTFWNSWDLSLENSLESSSWLSLVYRPTVTQVGRDIRRSVCSPALHLLSKGTCSSLQSPRQPFTKLIPAPPWPPQWWIGGWTVCSWLYCLLTLFENGCNTCLLLLSCGWDFRDSSSYLPQSIFGRLQQLSDFSNWSLLHKQITKLMKKKISVLF